MHSLLLFRCGPSEKSPTMQYTLQYDLHSVSPLETQHAKTGCIATRATDP